MTKDLALITTIESKKDYDAIVALRASAKDASVLKLFADYTVSKPQFSKSSGKYGETIEPVSYTHLDVYKRQALQ